MNNNTIPVRVVDARNLFAATLNSFSKQIGQPVNATQITSKIVVNFIRHKLTPYEAMMDATRVDKKNGFAQRAALRRDALKSIAAAYSHIPAIANEALRQLRETEATADQMGSLHATAEDISAYRSRRSA
jgi:hypothetical protein